MLRESLPGSYPSISDIISTCVAYHYMCEPLRVLWKKRRDSRCHPISALGPPISADGYCVHVARLLLLTMDEDKGLSLGHPYRPLAIPYGPSDR